MECELPFMRLWVNDLLADLVKLGLTDEEFGVYMRLLCVAWAEGSIPADPKSRARKVHSSPRKLERIWPVIEHKWVSNGNGGLVNRRQEEEREAALEQYRRRAEAGRKGGLSKAKAKPKRGSSNA